MSKIIGIDLGTTYSEVAVIENGRPVIIPDEDGGRIIPSVVGVSPSGELLVGTPAKNQYIAEPENTVKSIKRKMGTDAKVSIGGRSYTPPEISAFILRKLKGMAERYLGEKVEKAVITVPAYFSDASRQATKDAGEIAGLEVVRIINEPTAAALAYGLDREGDQFLIVYDLGGGTFDVSVIEINSGVVEVRASHGDTHLGGDDFDERIVNYAASDFLGKYSVDLKEDRKALARITRAAEATKIELSDRPFAGIAEEFIARVDDRPLHLQVELARHTFEDMISGLLRSTIDSIQAALRDAELAARDIDKVLMVGGSTRIPLVSRIVEDLLGLQPHLEIDPDLCVAMGAAVQAGIIGGEDIEAYLVDVAPHSLGIAVVTYKFGVLLEDRFSTLIRRNTAIPTSKSEVYSTLMDNQEAVQIKVYQGEHPTASENTLLGEFLLKDIPKAPAGEPQILVTFDYDVDGLVHVTAKDKKTGNEKSITVSASPDRLTETQKEGARVRSEEMWRASSQPAPDPRLDRGQAQEKEETGALIQRAKQMAEEVKDRKASEELLDLASRLEEAVRENRAEEIE
ncbi:MAG: Hsp70 family protein, partial [Candidatus Bathyarchaeia archaeon]